jgi:hypothetical protein
LVEDVDLLAADELFLIVVVDFRFVVVFFFWVLEAGFITSSALPLMSSTTLSKEQSFK